MTFSSKYDVRAVTTWSLQTEQIPTLKLIQKNGHAQYHWIKYQDWCEQECERLNRKVNKYGVASVGPECAVAVLPLSMRRANV